MSSSAIRALRVLKALKGRTFDGISNDELSKRLNESPANITRAMADLISEGLATKLDNGLFAPSIALHQIAVAYFDSIERTQNRIGEIKQRVIAGAQAANDY